MIPFEREFPLAAARARIEAALADHGLRWRATVHGEALHATLVELFDAEGRPLCTGVGKGDAETALVGGLFEAFEHHLALHDACSAHHVLTPAARVPQGLGKAIDALLAEQPESSMACRVYADFFHGGAALYPLALARPTYIDDPAPGDDFDYASLRRYACNSGTAIGSTPTEASLHAMNEAIERDDVSHFLRAHFHDRDDEALRVVDRRTVERDIERLWSLAERELGQDAILLDISSHKSAHTFLAFAPTCPHPVHVYGSGSSARASHGMRRALSELVQMHVMAQVAPAVANDLIRAELRLRPWPRLHRACVADLPARFDAARRQHVTPRNTASAGSVAAQLSQGMRGLRDEGYSPLVHTIHCRHGDIALCQVLVPGFEHYHIVGHGNLVVPSFPIRRASHARYA
ncbi:YcaO-like family protein [Luteibacter yeojuensis]|uniref:YcaO-like family protein n=1 Tax=Luteibacter yeojuensis TaxID=345309 RepID=A0A7X5QUK0_9GAMM|nr:YcaO-like family protein [Luteibacter yeojuensis]NID15599.1 YcaO-like family protein [Luteibacter yeojuensis]